MVLDMNWVRALEFKEPVQWPAHQPAPLLMSGTLCLAGMLHFQKSSSCLQPCPQHTSCTVYITPSSILNYCVSLTEL
jgi:hypothetical protein